MLIEADTCWTEYSNWLYLFKRTSPIAEKDSRGQKAWTENIIKVQFARPMLKRDEAEAPQV
jgi:hypothetical protein